MQETAYLLLQEDLSYPCKNLKICYSSHRRSERAVKRLKLQTPQYGSEENCENFYLCNNTIYPFSQKTARVGLFPTQHHLKKSKLCNGMKFKNIFAMSANASSNSSKSANTAQQQQSNVRKGKRPTTLQQQHCI